jgi:hypothetical protein
VHPCPSVAIYVVPLLIPIVIVILISSVRRPSSSWSFVLFVTFVFNVVVVLCASLCTL